MADETPLSGPYGLVIIPDAYAQGRSITLASDLMPYGSDFKLGDEIGGKPTIPHITLYHGKVKDLPITEAAELVSTANAALSGSTFELGPVDVAGGNFLFWNFTADSKAQVADVHQQALKMSQYLDPAVAAKALTDEGLSLSPEETANCKNYGHPWVADLYKPHITLGFHGEGLDPTQFEGKVEPYTIRVERVALVEVGHPGVILRELDLGRDIDPGGDRAATTLEP